VAVLRRPLAIILLLAASVVTSAPLRAQTKEHPLKPGESVKAPKQAKFVPPEYSEEAKQQNIRGIVILELLVNPQGRIDTVKVLRALPVVTDAAVKAAKQWVFEPTMFEGKAAWILLTVTVPFPPVTKDKE
jgi:TonB family protein